MSTLSFKTSLRSLWKLLYSFVDWSPSQAVPDHLQHFLQLDGRLKLWMTLVITSSIAPAMVYNQGLGSVIWSALVFG